MRHRLAPALLLLLLAADPACTREKTLPPVAPSSQAAAIQLGFAAGSIVAQGSQPLAFRKQSAMSFARSESDLYKFMGRLQIPEADAAAVASGLLDGFADPNPTRGSRLISDAMNQVMSRLGVGPYPELLWAFKVGRSIGHMAETVNVLTRGAPEPEHVQAYAVLTARDRETLQADLDQSGLPAELYDAVMAANIQIQSVSDLFATTRACRTIQNMVAQMR